MSKFSTEQEKFWAGEFGDDYISRNRGENLIASNTVIFARLFQRIQKIESIIEFGANIGMNIHAIGNLLPKAYLSAVEINAVAVEHLKKIPDLNIYHQSILEFESERHYDLVFTKGVLIHIDPNELQNVYERMYKSSKRYIAMVEYHSPSPVELDYRGHKEKLFKRDFAGELWEKYPDLTLLDYGFFYGRDPRHGQEDVNWFLFEKK
ncbi:pseudaminic acid biosynthesis-associated methylase [Sulfuricurvum kujiense DSM 16994]|uniref:Pseudaminic acid biosynthesis-associated methylase n=1 Tax=Sulfuricurvum kujiense (strain ATCC BAA-921 / DSM 16994 / JCM 11577 / YK-1) TaxID=709032 RepID=E4TXD2_SULKY|nr:pseudaminic acid biosynthesis-associated methylase [Sulfuricurvum kujiense]ADR32829.1 pseudaminic acid biosynthesis-associated methylase [Sulfuricurvum kujiense DSM 16994]